MSFLGTLLATIGSCVSIYGTLVNNLKRNHIRAMEIWSISNVILLVWATGLSMDLWNGGLSGVALIIMYGVFTVSNQWGLWKEKQKFRDEL